MEILLNRKFATSDTTFSEMHIDGIFKCFIVEDIERDVKVYGKTAIPTGTYEIELQTIGTKHTEYLKKYGTAFHKGMLHLKNVPNFEGIMIHIGNFAKDTQGCLLVNLNFSLKDNRGYTSTETYAKIYLIIRDAILRKEKVNITIKSNLQKKEFSND